MSAQGLVQIALNHNSSWRGKESIQLANASRPQEVLDFLQALSRMFERIGMRSVCERCFKRQPVPELSGWDEYKAFYKSAPQGGCCTHCSLLGHSSCMQKPLACAVWMCSSTVQAWPSTKELLVELASLFQPVGIREEALLHEMRTVWTERRLQALRIARHAVDAWTERPLWEHEEERNA